MRLFGRFHFLVKSFLHFCGLFFEVLLRIQNSESSVALFPLDLLLAFAADLGLMEDSTLLEGPFLIDLSIFLHLALIGLAGALIFLL